MASFTEMQFEVERIVRVANVIFKDYSEILVGNLIIEENKSVGTFSWNSPVSNSMELPGSNKHVVGDPFMFLQ